jgi:hypothetical protein
MMIFLPVYIYIHMLFLNWDKFMHPIFMKFLLLYIKICSSKFWFPVEALISGQAFG